ncbi:maleylacetoacetate isomerase [Shimia sp. MMG029]|uniref:maleylacetoacetate isomerase n=1 Tax=Shimia sp. MMG029 TaxID=3021978 RepID=UPI0022FEFDE8|nr:maleylacetoacetate isomerase [Shimia sp. MMG029]MDA5557294.1 maleylacetoacetate isomerase [Shimia sp. MMG029]
MSTVLYDYWRSSASYRVRIALHLAEIPFERVTVDLLKGAHKAPDHLARHALGLVPALTIDGQTFTQSLAILEYLNATRDMQLVPQDPAQAAKVRALAQTLAVDVHPVCNLSVVRFATQDMDNPMQASTAWMHHFIRPGLTAFEAQLAAFDQTPYACGDSVSLADICLIPQLYNATRWGIDVSDLPRTAAVKSACDALPAFAAAHPDALSPT